MGEQVLHQNYVKELYYAYRNLVLSQELRHQTCSTTARHQSADNPAEKGGYYSIRLCVGETIWTTERITEASRVVHQKRLPARAAWDS